jgi:hypothetical protein
MEHHSKATFVPSGMSQGSSQPYELGSNMRSSAPTNPYYKAIQDENGFVIVELSDRTLTVNPYLRRERKLGDYLYTFDKYTSASWFNPDSEISAVIPILMGAITYVMNHRPENYAFLAHKLLFCDSGGFELATHGEVINILEVARYYGEHADYGITLDMPEGDLDAACKELQKTLCQFQIWNSNVLFEMIPKYGSTVLFNVLRGMDLKMIKDCYEILYDARFNKHWSVSGNGWPVILKSCLLMEKGETNWLHVLGVTKPHMIPAIAFLSKYFNKVTTDASTHFQGQKNRKYLKLSMGDLKLDANVYMGNGYSCFDHPDHKLTCSCPICDTIGDALFFRFDYKDRMSQYLLTTHNIYAITKNLSLWSDASHRLSNENYLGLVAKIYGFNSEAFQFVKFIIASRRYGLDRAYSSVSESLALEMIDLKDVDVASTRLPILKKYISSYPHVYTGKFFRELPISVAKLLHQIED